MRVFTYSDIVIQGETESFFLNLFDVKLTVWILVVLVSCNIFEVEEDVRRFVSIALMHCVNCTNALCSLH